MKDDSDNPTPGGTMEISTRTFMGKRLYSAHEDTVCCRAPGCNRAGDREGVALPGPRFCAVAESSRPEDAAPAEWEAEPNGAGAADARRQNRSRRSVEQPR